MRPHPSFVCILLLLLPGCTTDEAPRDEIGGEEPQPEACLDEIRDELVFELHTGNYILVNPTNGGYMAGGRYQDIPWAADPDQVVKVIAIASWTVPIGGLEELRFILDDEDPGPFHESPFLIDGSSPLTIEVDDPLKLEQDQIRLTLGPAWNTTPIGGVVVVPQEVQVEVTQFIPCEG